MCCCFRFSNKSALVVTRILMAILISHSLAIRWKSVRAGHGTRALILLCAQARLGPLLGCLWFAFLRWNEPLPTDRKSAARLSPVIELKNELVGDIERDWQGNHWRAGAIGRRWRIVLDHTDPPFLVFVPKARRLHGWQLQALCLKRAISCRKSHGRIHRRVMPVRKWVPARPTKFADQLPDRRPSTAKRFHQPLQTDPVSFVPLFGNIGGAPPNGVSIHLFGSTERRLKHLPSHDTLVNAVVRVCASKGRVWKRPLAGIETVALVNERCGVPLTSWCFAAEDCLTSIAVARPLVQHKNSGEVTDIHNSL